MPKIIVTNRKTGKEEILKIERDIISIGRLKTNQISLDSNSISRKHAEIVKDHKTYVLMDNESGNGTFLNSQKLKPHEKYVLKQNDLIRIEEFEIKVIFPEIKEEDDDDNTDSGLLEVKMIKKVLNDLDSEQCPYVEIAGGAFKGKKAYLTQDLDQLVMGRDKECHLCVEDDVVSRKHALLQKKWGGVTIKDLESKNKTFVNNKEIGEVLLKDGDEILLGTLKLYYKNPQEIDFDSLNKEYEEKKGKEEAQKKPEEKSEKQEESVSQEAQMSIDPDKQSKSETAKNKEGKEETAKEKQPEPEEKKAEAKKEKPQVKVKGTFFPMEKILMTLGILILLGAVGGLIFLLFN